MVVPSTAENCSAGSPHQLGSRKHGLLLGSASLWRPFRGVGPAACICVALYPAAQLAFLCPQRSCALHCQPCQHHQPHGASCLPGRVTGTLVTTGCACTLVLVPSLTSHQDWNCHSFASSPSHSVWPSLLDIFIYEDFLSRMCPLCLYLVQPVLGRIPQAMRESQQDEPQL